MKIRKDLLENLQNIAEFQNDHWITVKPHGDEEKGRHVLIKDGEDLDDAMKRQWGKDDKPVIKKSEDKELLARVKATKDYRKKVMEFEKDKKASKDKVKAKKPNSWEDDPKKMAERIEYNVMHSDIPLSEYQKTAKKFEKVYGIPLYKLMKEIHSSDKKASEPQKDETLKDKWDKEYPSIKEKGYNNPYDLKAGKWYKLNNAGVSKFAKYDKNGTPLFYTDKEGHYQEYSPHNLFKEIEEPTVEKFKTEPQKEPDLDTLRNNYLETIKNYNKADNDAWHGENDQIRYKGYVDAKKYKSQLTKDRKAYAESIMKNFVKSDDTTYQDKLEARKNRYEELADKNKNLSSSAHKQFNDMMSFIPAGQPIHGQKDANYRERAWNKLGQGVALSDKAKYFEDKASSVGLGGISSDDANAIAKLADKYKRETSSAERRRIIDRVIGIDSSRRKAEQEKKNPTDYSKYGFNVDRNTSANRLQLHFDNIPSAEERQILKSNGFRWSPSNKAWQRQLNANSDYALKRVTEALDKKQG